ncbi:MAG: class I SAM-dependent methyltransferase [Patescibacteria group bacterium]
MVTSSNRFYDTYHKKNRNSLYHAIITDSNFTYFYTLKYLKKVLEMFGLKKLEILDLGCGVGTIDFYLAKKGHELTGIDISQDAIDICNQVKKELEFLNATFVQGDVQKTHFKKKFDFVICSEVIEHVEDDVGLLKTIGNLLTDSGVLLLTTPSVNAPLYRLGFLKSFERRVGHLRRYQMKKLIELIEQAGFEIVETAKTESVVRNALYTFPILGYLIKGLRGPLVPVFHFFDQMGTTLVGESDLVIIARKL